MLDYYVASSLSGKLSDAVELRPFYDQWVALYKALNGQMARGIGGRCFSTNGLPLLC